MRRLSVVVGILGLAWAAVLPAGAQTQMKLFGKTYNVVIEGRDQTFKTADGRQVKIVLTPADSYTQKAGLYFVEGADPSKDRLFFTCHLDADDDGPIWHQFYLLTGADANGDFTPASATLTEFFGGAGDRLAGGRPWNSMLINDDNTGVKQDRNVVMLQWTQDNGYRLYDLDSMSSKNYEDQELYFRPTGALGSTTEDRYKDIVVDENAPWGDVLSFAPMPTDDKHTILALGASQDGGPEVSVWDTKTDKFYTIRTNLATQTVTSNTPIPSDTAFDPSAVIRYGDTGEYWFILSNPRATGSGISVDEQTLYRVKLTFPADLTKAKAGDIKVEVLGKEDLLATPLKTSPGGVFGMAVGREVAPGLRRLYFGTLDGKLAVATPVP
jgi:hypothetical protein